MKREDRIQAALKALKRPMDDTEAVHAIEEALDDLAQDIEGDSEDARRHKIDWSVLPRAIYHAKALQHALLDLAMESESVAESLPALIRQMQDHKRQSVPPVAGRKQADGLDAAFGALFVLDKLGIEAKPGRGIWNELTGALRGRPEMNNRSHLEEAAKHIDYLRR